MILWQRPASTKSGGWVKKDTRDAAGGFTPYDTGWLRALQCTSGYTIHYQMTSDVVTPDGGGPENWNSKNSRRQ
jgi:hypothetical protein